MPRQTVAGHATTAASLVDLADQEDLEGLVDLVDLRGRREWAEVTGAVVRIYGRLSM